MEITNLKKSNRLAQKVALIYVFVAGCWILFSDELVKMFISNSDARMNLSIIKGLGFVLVTGSLLYLVLRRLLRRWEREIEQRKQAEAAQQDSEARYRRLFAVQNDAVILMDYQTNQILEVNPAAEEMYGYSHAEFLRLAATQVLHEPEKTSNAMAAEVRQVPLRMHRRKDGTVFPVEISCSDFIYQGRKLQVASMRDITRRQQVEAALLKSKQRYQDLFEHMNEGVAYCQMIFEDGQPKDFVYLAVNQKFSALTGLKDVIGKRVSEVIPGLRESDAELLEIYGRVAATGKPERFERFVVSLNLWFDISVYGTERDCFVVVFDVISERKQAEAALQEREEQYRKVMEASPVSIFILQQKRFVLFNGATLKLFGASRREDLIGRDIFDFIHPDFQELIRGRIVQAAQQEQPLHLLEQKLLRLDGSIVEVEATSARFQFQGQPALLVEAHDITERKQADREIQRQAAFAHFNPNPVLELSAMGEVMYFNAAALQMAGTLGQEHPSQILPPNTAAIVRDCLATTKPILRLETHTKNRTISWSFFPVALNGVVHCYAGDITERKRAEDELRWKTAFLEAQVDATPDGILVVDAQGEKILQNRRMNELWKIPPQIVENKDNAEQIQFVTSQAKNPRQFSEKITFLYAHPDEISRDEIELIDGTVLDRYSSPVRDKAGKHHYGRIWTFRDITGIKLAAQRMNLQLNALTAAANGIVITDRNGIIEWVNPAFTKLTGYTAEEAIGKNPRMLKSGQHPPGFHADMWQVILAGNVWHGEVVNKRKDGQLYTEEMTITAVRDADGQITHFVAIKQDITERRKLEVQLRHGQKMDAIGQLASGVAHDFNNILTVIQLQAGLLKAGQNLSDQQRDFAGEIEQATKRAADLTGQLLLFGRKQALQLRDLDLNDVVTNLAKMLQRIVAEDVVMKFRYSPQPLLIHADAGMMDQILMNLTVNARDAMPDGGRLIIETSAVEFDEVTAAQMAQGRPGAFGCVSVTDTGCGIPAEILPHIFEPFFTTKDAGKGTGLGLATVFGIVQQHQGWINVYSETGHGTTFRVYLPRLMKTPDPKAGWVSLATIGGGNETILLVEDDASLRAAVRNILSRLGYHVLEAPTGVAALAVWQQHRSEIQLLLTDMVMPEGINGKELAQRLLKENSRLKVIYASGYCADIASKDLRLEEGVNFLTKPFEAHKLAQTVRHCLDAI